MLYGSAHTANYTKFTIALRANSILRRVSKWPDESGRRPNPNPTRV